MKYVLKSDSHGYVKFPPRQSYGATAMVHVDFVEDVDDASQALSITDLLNTLQMHVRANNTYCTGLHIEKVETVTQEVTTEVQ